MSAETPGDGSRVGYWMSRFRAWRWQRPFWAGLLTVLAGLPIMYFPYANLTLGQLTVRMATTAGSGSLIIGVLLVVLGLTLWYQPVVKNFAGVATILLSLVSLVISNFGGFLMGFLLGLIGGTLAVSWAPGKPAEAGPDPAALPDGDTTGDGDAAPLPPSPYEAEDGVDGTAGGAPAPYPADAEAADPYGPYGRHPADAGAAAPHGTVDGREAVEVNGGHRAG
jgi:hypothetical protein